MSAAQRPGGLGEPARCQWAKGALDIEHHDTEWGVPCHDDRVLFEFLILEGAQAGLSWSTILGKRAGYRRAFADFDPARVARFTPARIERLVQDPSIVRHRQKIEAAVGNARAFNARTGAKLWEFSSVAQPGTIGHDTWEGGSWKGRLGVNAWPFYFTFDEARRLQAGDVERFGDVELRVLHPPPPEWERQRVRNEDSVVLEFRLGNVSLILPGDIGREGERAILPRLEPGRIVVLKAPHHGSATSSTSDLLATLRPAAVIFSCGRNNRFGHPHPAVVERYRAMGAEMFSTAEDGAVVVETDGNDVALRGWTGRQIIVRR